MKIALVTDAWKPQVNGVVRTYTETCKALESLGHEVMSITPDQFRTVPCPTYPSIRLALWPGRGIERKLEAFAPQVLHIATEGPLGQAAHRLSRKRGWRFTSSFHTQFPEYVRARLPVPVRWSYAYLRRWHGYAECTMVPTPSQAERLREWGFERLEIWSRGVDTSLFKPRPKDTIDAPRPISLFTGRVAVEKNLAAFLSLNLPGTKVVVGDGPDRKKLEAEFPDALFVGERHGEDLAAHVAAADVFVFPSRTDTFGVVMLEAMACGVPVAAFPVTGPLDVVQQGVTGALDDDLGRAVRRALELSPQACVDYARSRTWEACSRTFASLLVPRLAG